MVKKMVDQSWGTGIWERAWGKVTNTRPGPSVTTVCGAKEYFMFNIEEMATRVSRNVYHCCLQIFKPEEVPFSGAKMHQKISCRSPFKFLFRKPHYKKFNNEKREVKMFQPVSLQPFSACNKKFPNKQTTTPKKSYRNTH